MWETFCSVVSKKSRDQRNDSHLFSSVNRTLGRLHFVAVTVNLIAS